VIQTQVRTVCREFFSQSIVVEKALDVSNPKIANDFRYSALLTVASAWASEKGI